MASYVYKAGEYFCCFIEGDSLSTPSQDVFSTCTDQDEHEITEQVGFVVKETESFTTQAEGTYLDNLLSFLHVKWTVF